MNTPLTHEQVKKLPLGFTATGDENRSERRRLKAATVYMNNRSVTSGRMWFRNTYLPKVLKSRMAVAKELNAHQEIQQTLEAISGKQR